MSGIYMALKKNLRQYKNIKFMMITHAIESFTRKLLNISTSIMKITANIN